MYSEGDVLGLFEVQYWNSHRETEKDNKKYFFWHGRHSNKALKPVIDAIVLGWSLEKYETELDLTVPALSTGE
jgi:hypothetical protein